MSLRFWGMNLRFFKRIAQFRYYLKDYFIQVLNKFNCILHNEFRKSLVSKKLKKS